MGGPSLPCPKSGHELAQAAECAVSICYNMMEEGGEGGGGGGGVEMYGVQWAEISVVGVVYHQIGTIIIIVFM